MSSTKSDDPLDALLSSYASASASASTSTSTSGQVAGPAKKKEYSYKDFEAILESTPLFMQQTPKDGETSDLLEALRTLVFDGEGDEVASNFKNHGNELHLQKSYSEAIKAYTDGINAHPQDNKLRISLLNNRAQCHLLLKNHASVLKDTGTIIALYTADKIENDKSLVKAMYRATQSLIALERWKEALDVIERGKEQAQELNLQDDIKLWIKAKLDVEKGLKRENYRVERIRKENLIKISLKKAISQRGLIEVKTNSPPDNPNPIHFDPEYREQEEKVNGWQLPSPEDPLIYPVFLLYPNYGQSDFITHFNENTSFQDQFNVMFPSSPASSSSSSTSSGQVPWIEWDSQKEYWIGNLVVYVETSQKRLLKVGKELTLREVIAKAKREEQGDIKKDGVVLRDGLMSFIVLPKGEKEKKWIEQFKMSRDGQ
ncbi:uncharacterized protein IL334_002506 [Kwoniella shivajii]|uniref:Cns1/TTC4 wheel domain-containing protein n=1 Tax=Kwoniella shivajii TaxID=564305 RepID=A0ABZ1CUW9_9TREE|nr:hypothetical protein IL334_002506 [Kwoniella shivajii]